MWFRDLLGYHFRKSRFLGEALFATGSSRSEGHAEGDRLGNKPLAFVGDDLTRLNVTDDWYVSGASTGKCLGTIL